MDHVEQREVVLRYQEALRGSGAAGPELLAGLDRLFAAHQDRIYGLCVRILNDAEQAREVAQESMLTAFRKLGEFEGRSSFGTWLYGIARGLCFNAVRKRGELLTRDGVLVDGGEAATALGRLRAIERQELVRQASAALDPLEQEVVHLRFVESLPYDRISEVLGLTTASGARAVLQRTRRKLAREIRTRLALLGHGSSFLKLSQTLPVVDVDER